MNEFHRYEVYLFQQILFFKQQLKVKIRMKKAIEFDGRRVSLCRVFSLVTFC